MKNFFGFLTIFLSISGCVAPIYFNEPQPSFVDQEEGFPTSYLGRYLNYEDSTYVIIYEGMVLMEPDWFGDNRSDTLFNLSNENILKFYKGKYFLNYKDPDGDWALHLMELNNNMLSFYCFDLPEENDKIRKFGSVIEKKDDCGDIVKIIIKPTRKGFKKLIKRRNLERLSLYEKIDH